MEEVKAEAAGTGTAMPVPPRPPVFGAPPSAAATMSPSRSPFSPPPAPVVTQRSTDPRVVLDELVRSVEGVRSALLASVDGFGVARSSSMPDEAAHPAMLAAAVGLAHQLAAMGGGTRLRQLVVEHDGGLLVVWPVGTQRVLAVLTASSVEQRRLRAFVQSRVDVLSGTRT